MDKDQLKLPPSFISFLQVFSNCFYLRSVDIFYDIFQPLQHSGLRLRQLRMEEEQSTALSKTNDDIAQFGGYEMPHWFAPRFCNQHKAQLDLALFGFCNVGFSSASICYLYVMMCYCITSRAGTHFLRF